MLRYVAFAPGSNWTFGRELLLESSELSPNNKDRSLPKVRYVSFDSYHSSGSRDSAQDLIQAIDGEKTTKSLAPIPVSGIRT